MTVSKRIRRVPLNGKATVDYMVRLLTRDQLTISDVANRYQRTSSEIIAYLEKYGYDKTGNRIGSKTTARPAGSLKLSAGGSAHYVAATSGVGVPLAPVPYRDRRPVPRGLDWSSITVEPDPAVSSAVRRSERARSVNRRVGASGDSGRAGPPPRFTPAEDRELRRLYDEERRSVKDIAQSVGAADVTVARAIRRAGGTILGRGAGRWRNHTKQSEQQQEQEAS